MTLGAHEVAMVMHSNEALVLYFATAVHAGYDAMPRTVVMTGGTHSSVLTGRRSTPSIVIVASSVWVLLIPGRRSGYPVIRVLVSCVLLPGRRAICASKAAP